MTENSQNENKVLLGSKVKTIVRDAVETIAREDDRSVSNTVARLLETHPEVQKKISETTAQMPIAA